MKLLLALLVIISSTAVAQYDSTLAKALNADEYGMKKYVLVIIKTGPNKFEKAAADSLFMGHMKNIGRLADEGKLLVAGPFGKNSLNYRGIFILNATDLEEAAKLINTDPAIYAGMFQTDLLTWYATAALQETFKIHKRIQKNSM